MITQYLTGKWVSIKQGIDLLSLSEPSNLCKWSLKFYENGFGEQELHEGEPPVVIATDIQWSLSDTKLTISRYVTVEIVPGVSEQILQYSYFFIAYISRNSMLLCDNTINGTLLNLLKKQLN